MLSVKHLLCKCTCNVSHDTRDHHWQLQNYKEHVAKPVALSLLFLGV